MNHSAIVSALMGWQRTQTQLRSPRAVGTQHAGGARSMQAERTEGWRGYYKESATEAAAGGQREVSQVQGNQEREAELYSQEARWQEAGWNIH